MNNIFPPSQRKGNLHHTKLFFKLYLKVLKPFLSQRLQKHSNTQSTRKGWKIETQKNKLPFNIDGNKIPDELKHCMQLKIMTKMANTQET